MRPQGAFLDLTIFAAKLFVEASTSPSLATARLPHRPERGNTGVSACFRHSAILPTTSSNEQYRTAVLCFRWQIERNSLLFKGLAVSNLH